MAENTQELKGNSRTIIGIVVGLFGNLLGLLGLFIWPKETKDRETYIKGWLIGFIISTVVAVIVVIVAISIANNQADKVMDMADQAMQNFPTYPGI